MRRHYDTSLLHPRTTIFCPLPSPPPPPKKKPECNRAIHLDERWRSQTRYTEKGKHSLMNGLIMNNE